MGPDMAKGKTAAIKIFKIMQRPSAIDVMSEDVSKSKDVSPINFEGSIEFRDVWFRYPTRRQQWIFKGLNLKINPKDSIAIVGESG